MSINPRVFIGYDKNEIVAFHTAAASVWRHCPSAQVIPCSPESMGISRSRDPRQSTDFAFCRFAVPHYCNYEGWAVFMDADMILRADIRELFALADEECSVMVVKHDYESATETKFLNQANVPYRCKNWSSVMLFNNALCRRLSKHYVNTATGLELHQFKWTTDGRIGSLDPTWNHLVGEYEPNPDAKLVHWTLGGPYFDEYKGCEHSDEWRDLLDEMNSCAQRTKPVISHLVDAAKRQ